MATHSMSVFQLTIRNGAIPGRDKNAVLDQINVGGKIHDFLAIVEQFAAANSKSFKTVMLNKVNRLVSIRNINQNRGAREVSFYVRHGTFGMPGEIVDSASKKTAYKKRSVDSDVFDYFVQIRVPRGSKVALAALHSIGNVGVKSWLSDYLGLEVNQRLSRCGLHVLPLCSKIALSTYLKEAEVRSIRVTNFQPEYSGDLANFLTDPKVEKDLILKQEGGFGRLGKFFRSGSVRDQLIAISDPHCTDVKAEIILGGKSRVISLEGSKTPKAKFYLTEEEVSFKDGIPQRTSISNFATALLDDLFKEINSGN